MKSDPEQTGASEADAGFIRRLAELSQAPKADAARRVAFQAELDRRLARRPRRFVLPALAGALATAAVLVLSLRSDVVQPAEAERRAGIAAKVSRIAPAQPSAATSVEALLALASEGDGATDASLPDEYIAIASLFLSQ
jgi:hypothetical protein